MKPPVIQRFQKQNYPGSPDWFTRFLSDLSQFTEVMWNVMNKNITPGDNLDSQLYTTTILAGAAPEDNAFQFELDMNHTPSIVVVGYVADTEAYQVPLTSAVGIQWTVAGQTVSVASVTGLTSGQTYSLTLLLL